VRHGGEAGSGERPRSCQCCPAARLPGSPRLTPPLPPPLQAQDALAAAV
jgi:hypothetical protein